MKYLSTMFILRIEKKEEYLYYNEYDYINISLNN